MASSSCEDANPPSPPPISAVHDALTTQLMKQHTEYLASFRSTQEMTLADLQHVSHSVSATSEKLDQAEVVFSKLPLYIGKLQQMQRNLVILKDNAHRTNALARQVAAQLGVTVESPCGGRPAAASSLGN
jgi:hypothetical protein